MQSELKNKASTPHYLLRALLAPVILHRIAEDAEGVGRADVPTFRGKIRTMNRMTIAAAGTLVLAGTVSANTIDMTFEGSGSFGRGGLDLELNGAPLINRFAGRLTFDVHGSTGDTPFGNGRTLYTFCTEIAAPAEEDNTTYNVYNGPNNDNGFEGLGELPDPGAAMGLADAARVSYLFVNYFRDAISGSSNNASDKDMAAAFQLALWDIVFDDDLDVDAGGDDGFAVTDAPDSVLTLAQTMLTDVALNANLEFVSEKVFGFGNQGANGGNGAQDQITMIPLPGAAMMGLVGLGGVMAVRRRRGS